MTGKVYLVGAGPGDPNLITLRAIEVIKKADVVLYDRLVSKKILNMIPKRAESIYVGTVSYTHLPLPTIYSV